MISDFKKVCAIVVLYNPDLIVLHRLLKSVINQVGQVRLVDNTPDVELAKMDSEFSHYGASLSYEPFNENHGIAYAQNRGIDYAKNNNFSHVLLLDQDSELPAFMTEKLLEAEKELLKNDVKVAAVGPSFIDEKSGHIGPAVCVKFFRIKRIPITEDIPYFKSDYIIASGSLIRLSILDVTGVMDEKLFIDWVDIEWGERCSKLGYDSFIVSSVQMKHSIGDSYVQFLGRNINLHSDFRNYFIVRNASYLLFRNNLKFKSKFLLIVKIPYYIIMFSYLSKRKLYSVSLLTKAFLDGVVGRMYKGYFK
ncbi:glycosyltransferase family 2 protein [Rahnella sp. PCH160]|uniref:glycosyltransferase family 2 protein n=1 Tax=Rahnella sp. PCH160 TaxID=3447928 RepID=UPI0039FCA866